MIDKFGLLKNIYRYTDLAYIGGGLDVGVHNTTEAAIHGNYLLFGPNYENFDDAKFYVNKEIALVVKNVAAPGIPVNWVTPSGHNPSSDQAVPPPSFSYSE